MRRLLAGVLSSVAVLAIALLFVPVSDAQDDPAGSNGNVGLTQDEVFALLEVRDYNTLDQRLNALQIQFEQDASAEEPLHEGFAAFAAVHSEADAVEAALTAWVEQYPRSYAARLARGIFCTDQGLDARGTQYASKTSKHQFEEMERWFERGRADLEASLELATKPLLSHMWLMTQAMRSRADDGEERYYRAAVAYAPRSIELRVLYMTSLEPRWGGSYEEMEAHARESDAALGPGPDANRLHRLIAEDRGSVLMEREDYSAAHAVYSKAIERYGGRGVRCGRAWASVKLGRWPDAMEDMTAAMQEPKPHEYCADVAAWMAGTKPDHPGMFELVDGYARHNPGHDGLLARRGWALQQRGDLAAAYRDYAAAAEQGNVWAQTMAGRYVFNGWAGVPVNKEKGLALFRAAAQSGDRDAQLCLVQALQSLGRGDEAAAEQKRLTVLKRARAHTAEPQAEVAPAGDWLAYALDRRVQAVALGAFLMLLIGARSRRG